MPAAQIAAGHALISDIHSRYPGIPVSGHRDHDTTACPGKNFPAELLNHKEAEDMSIDEFISKLTDKEAYEILTKAQRHAATLPVPDWAKTQLVEAVEAGVTDGESPMQLVPRYQAAIMARRSK
jgi:N-acetyl-anhydromuramyl-L-alanine amidase AmpD